MLPLGDEQDALCCHGSVVLRRDRHFISLAAFLRTRLGRITSRSMGWSRRRASDRPVIRRQGP